MPGLRGRFVLELVDGARRRANALGISRVQMRLSGGAARWFSGGSDRSSYPDSIPLDEATTLLLCIDDQLGVGSGQYLEQLIAELAQVTLARDVVSLATSTPRSLLLRLSPVIESAWVDIVPSLVAVETAGVLRVELGVPGSPRATRFLVHQVLGTLQAVRQLAPMRHTETQRPLIEWFGDRARFELSFRPTSLPVEDRDSLPPPSRPSQRGLRAARPSLSEQVESILGHREPEARSSHPPSGSSPPSSPPSARSDSQRSMRAVRLEDKAPSLTSLTTPRLPRLPPEFDPLITEKSDDDDE